MGGDRNVRLWSSNNGYLHAVDNGISSTTNLPQDFAPEALLKVAKHSCNQDILNDTES